MDVFCGLATKSHCYIWGTLISLLLTIINLIISYGFVITLISHHCCEPQSLVS